MNKKALSIEGYSRSNKSIENGWEVKRWSISNKCYSTLNLVLKVVKLRRAVDGHNVIEQNERKCKRKKLLAIAMKQGRLIR